MVGGTAIALQIGHRRSIDFDLFSAKNFDTSAIKAKFEEIQPIDSLVVERVNELTFFSDDVKYTFFYFSYPFEVTGNFEDFFRMPDLLTLSALKAFSLGRRAKWKDYVDLYFLLNIYDVEKVSDKTLQIFGDHFSRKLFRQQLSYFEDINYSEKVEFMPGFGVPEDVIKEALINHAIS